jgi:hypothetical protein
MSRSGFSKSNVMALEVGAKLMSDIWPKFGGCVIALRDSWLGNCAGLCGVAVGVGRMLMKTCPQEPYTDCMCSWRSFNCCSVGAFEGERGGCWGDCARSVRRGVRGEEICTGDRNKVSWGPGWGWLCDCATCIESCGVCPRLVILTVLSSCRKVGVSFGPGCVGPGKYPCCWACMASKLIAWRSRLMPGRCRRCDVVAGSGRTVGASKAAGVEFCRRCWFRRRWMPDGMFVDSITYAGRVRCPVSCVWNLGSFVVRNCRMLVAGRTSDNTVDHLD